MRIKELTFEDKSQNWKLETTSFSDLTLLVGISGVGKTKILNSISTLKKIANGTAMNGVKWEVSFVTNSGDSYCWEGEYDILDRHNLFQDMLPDNDKEKEQPSIIFEKLSNNHHVVAQRNGSSIFLGETETPKLSPYKSILSLLSEEDSIKPAYNNMRRIVNSEFSERSLGLFVSTAYKRELEKKPSLEEIKDLNLPSEIKIALVYQLAKNLFEKVKGRFIEVFPQVIDVRYEAIEKEEFTDFFGRVIPILQIKERGVNDWIDQFSISSGMYKTFMHLSELFLLPKGTVVLIDEFENSLGVNCIDVLTEDLLNESSNLQFIVTSHHPYIINNIDTDYWKIVTRKGGIVTTKDAKSLGFDKSKHKAFLQLLNLEEYQEGVFTS
jgi:predicted ATP-dependent endonuclease of OLD family